MKKAKVLLLCSQNSVRSQIAEAFFKKYAADILEVYSAGMEPSVINPYTIQVMQEIGFDLSGYRSKGFRELLGQVHFTHVISVCKRVEGKCPAIFPGARHYLAWPFEDPASFEGSEEEKLDKFRQIRDQIKEQVKAWVQEYREKNNLS